MSSKEKLQAIREQLERAEAERAMLARNKQATALDRAALDAHISALSKAYCKAALR